MSMINLHLIHTPTQPRKHVLCQGNLVIVCQIQTLGHYLSRSFSDCVKGMHLVGRAVVLNLSTHGNLAECFRWVFHIANFSTKSTTTSSIVADYLTTSLGFSADEAIVTSSKVRSSKPSAKLASLVNFFKKSGLDPLHIKQIIYETPKIVSCDVDTVIKPRIKILKDLGLSGSDLAMAIGANNKIWWRSLNCHLMPICERLRSICSDENVSKALMKSSFFSHPSCLGNFHAVIACLQDYGFSHAKIEKLILEKPRVFIMNPKRVHDCLVIVEEKLQIPRDSNRFYCGFLTLVSISEKTMESKIEAYKSFGFTEQDVWTLAGKIPGNLKISEAKIRDGLNFYMKVVGLDSSQIVTWPMLLLFSLKRRAIPRWILLKGLKEKGLVVPDYSLGFFFLQTDCKFANFVLEFKNDAPDLCEEFFRSTRSLLHTEDAEQTAA